MADAVSLLKDCLTEYEAKCYIGLERYGPQKAGELAERVDVPRARIYDVLKSLEEKGAADRIQEDPLKYASVDPEKAIKPLYNTEIQRFQHRREEALDQIKSIEKVGTSEEELEERIELMTGYEEMYSRLAEIYLEAEEEVLILSVGEETPDRIIRNLRKLVERGVEVRFIASKLDQENIDILEEFQERIGWKMRHYDTSEDFSISVIDREQVALNVRDPDTEEERFTVNFEVEGMAKALAEYFEGRWKEAGEIEI